MLPSKAASALLPGALTLLVLFGGYGAVRLVRNARSPEASPNASPTLSPQLEASPLPSLQLPVIRADTDGDGLPDDLERIYQTDPENPDTDGDGYEDGLEVANGYDPTKKAPGDKITIPKPAVPSPAPTYTEQFLSRTGLPPEPRSLLKSDELGSFIAEANVRGFLPDVPDADITIVSVAGKDAITRYLDAVSIPQNANISPVSAEQLSAAFKTLATNGDEAPLTSLVAKLSRNVEELKRAPVPGEAIALHKQFVAATVALRDNAEKLLAYRTDYVGALVAASRIENLRSVFKAVAEGIQQLEEKYGIS